MAKAGKDGASMQKLIEELKLRLLRMEKQLVELREENLALKEMNGMGSDEIGLKRDYQDIKFRYQQLLIENEQLKSQPDLKSNYNKLLAEYIYIYILFVYRIREKDNKLVNLESEIDREKEINNDLRDRIEMLKRNGSNNDSKQSENTTKQLQSRI